VDAALLGEIAGDPLSVSLRLRPLSEPAVAELVRERLGADDHAAFSAACHAATGGNPLLLNELLMALDAERVTPDAAHVGMVADLGSHEGLRASRARIVRAADGERRRIARDLHDGLQARLVLLAIKANGLREGAPASAGLRADAAELEEGLRAAITELRELVHGVMPAALTERGLYAAAEELTDRVPIPTELDFRHNGTALPGPVESTGYFVVCEALANAVKHSRASGLAVRLEHAGQRLRIESATTASAGPARTAARACGA
jgi:signal transduction histidine kinase